jgi:hypothetical protein
VSDCVGALLCKNYIKLKKIDLVCQKKKIILNFLFHARFNLNHSFILEVRSPYQQTSWETSIKLNFYFSN